MNRIMKMMNSVIGGDYYSQFEWMHKKTTNEADDELNAKELTDEDRVLDMLLVMDCTGSMASWIELSKRTLTSCIDDVKEQHKELDVRVSFVGYRDFGERKTIFAIHDFTMDTQAITTFISEQQATGGGDAAEDVQGALQQGLDLNWRENSIKMCYFCADAPAHGKQYHAEGVGDYHPKGNPGGLVLEDQMLEFSNREIDFTVYCLTNQTNQMYEVMEQAYNQGTNAKEFKKIDLRQEIKEVQAKGESLVAPSGSMERKYLSSTAFDVTSRAKVKYSKKGW